MDFIWIKHTKNTVFILMSILYFRKNNSNYSIDISKIIILIIKYIICFHTVVPIQKNINIYLEYYILYSIINIIF